MNDKKVVLVGLGPHAKRIYMKCFELNHMSPALIIDIKSKKKEIEKYIKAKGLNSKLFFIDDSEGVVCSLTKSEKEEIIKQCHALKVTHAIISTEPKAHYDYICLFLKNYIHVLVDKPLTAPINVSTDIKQAQKIWEEYEDIRNLYNQVQCKNVILQLQCQRRWHKGYQLIHQIASDTIDKYNIPITAIQVSHCDGMWNMPNEFITRENHPYKYGYGKLLHSGYHFLDLVAWFESINDKLIEKASDNVELYAAAIRPSDFMTIINKNDYRLLFDDNKFDNLFDHISDYKFEKYGEVDVYSLIQFKHKNKAICTATLNLMQNGFSRRAWNELPKDTYKGNGRVRHEYMNIQIGPLMNIQVHSYQSKEVKDRSDKKYGIGEVEHFDIYVFRNTEIIGGSLLEKFTLNDLLYNGDSKMQGYNEDAREKCFKEFISCQVEGDPIYEHELSVKLLAKEYESLCKRMKGLSPVISFPIKEERL